MNTPSPETNFGIHSKAIAIALSGLALSGCGVFRVGNTFHTSGEVVPVEATIEGRLRYDPQALSTPDGLNNICFDTRNIGGLNVKSNVLVDNNLDANGPWLGLDLSTLPQEIQSSCVDDKDKVIWFSENTISKQN